jgi:hypothetical protein
VEKQAMANLEIIVYSKHPQQLIQLFPPSKKQGFEQKPSMFGNPYGRERVKHQKHSELTLDKEIVKNKRIYFYKDNGQHWIAFSWLPALSHFHRQIMEYWLCFKMDTSTKQYWYYWLPSILLSQDKATCNATTTASIATSLILVLPTTMAAFSIAQIFSHYGIQQQQQ